MMRSLRGSIKIVGGGKKKKEAYDERIREYKGAYQREEARKEKKTGEATPRGARYSVEANNDSTLTRFITPRPRPRTRKTIHHIRPH